MDRAKPIFDAEAYIAHFLRDLRESKLSGDEPVIFTQISSEPKILDDLQLPLIVRRSKRAEPPSKIPPRKKKTWCGQCAVFVLDINWVHHLTTKNHNPRRLGTTSPSRPNAAQLSGTTQHKKQIPQISSTVVESNAAVTTLTKKVGGRCKICGSPPFIRHLPWCSGNPVQNAISPDHFHFRLLAPGESFRDASRRENTGLSNACLLGRDYGRIDQIESLKDFHRTWFGVERMAGYGVFTFRNTDRVVLESPKLVDATYVLSHNWKSMIHLNKQEIRQQFPYEFVRKLHTDIGWLRRVEKALLSR